MVVQTNPICGTRPVWMGRTAGAGTPCGVTTNKASAPNKANSTQAESEPSALWQGSYDRVNTEWAWKNKPNLAVRRRWMRRRTGRGTLTGGTPVVLMGKMPMLRKRLAASLRTGLLRQTKPISAAAKWRASVVQIRSCGEWDTGEASEEQSQFPAGPGQTGPGSGDEEVVETKPIEGVSGMKC